MWIDQSRCFEQAALGGKYGVPEAKEGGGGGVAGSHCWGVLKLFSVTAAFFFSRESPQCRHSFRNKFLCGILIRSSDLRFAIRLVFSAHVSVLVS